MDDNEEYSNKDILQLKLYICVLEYAWKVVYAICQDSYYHHPSSAKGTKDLNEFCKIMVKKGPKKVFGIRGPQKLPFNDFRNEPDENFFLSICITFFGVMNNNEDFKKNFCKVHDCFESISRIKNKMGHKYNFEERELEDFKKELEKKIKQAGNCADKIFEECNYKRLNADSFKKISETMIDKMNELWDYNLREDIPELKKYIKKRDEDCINKLLPDCQKELREEGSVYNNLINTAPSFFHEEFGLSTKEVFVPMPFLMKGKKVDYLDMFRCKERVVIVSGDAGYGKTTICKKFILEWLEPRETFNKSFQSQFDLVLLIELKRAKEKNLAHYLKEILLPKTFNQMDDDDIHFFLNQFRILVIIDAYECLEDACNLITTLFALLSNQKFFITVKPDHLKDIKSHLKTYDLSSFDVQLQGFEEKDKGKLVEQIWPVLEIKKNIPRCLKYLKYLERLPVEFQTVLKVPFINILMIYSWISNKEEVLQAVTFTDLYLKVFHLQEAVIADKMKCGDKAVKALIEALAEHCYENKVPITGDTMISCLREKFQERELRNVRYLFSTLFLFTPSLQNCWSQYEFLHESQMEFLAASHAFSLITRENSKWKLKNLELLNEKQKRIFAFTLGHLNAKDKLQFFMKEVCDILKGHSSDYNLLSKCLNETMSKSYSDNQFKVNIELKKLLSNSLEWKLDEGNVVSALNLLHYIDVEQVEIKISEKYEVHDIMMFHSALKNVCKHKAQKTDIDLHFEKHVKEGNMFSDDFLPCLKPWANLRRFSGCLSEKGIEHLHSCENLIKIEVQIKSVTALNSLINVCNKKSGLNELRIIFNEVFKKNSSIDKLDDFEGSRHVAIQFNRVTSKNLALDMLEKMKPNKGTFSIISMKLIQILTYETAKGLLLKLGKYVSEEVQFKSDYEVTEEVYLKLYNDVKFHFRWNTYGQ